MAKRKAEEIKDVYRPPESADVTPYLVFDGAKKAMDWYHKVFNARIGEIHWSGKPNESNIMHATFYVGDCAIHAGDDFKGDLRAASGKPRLQTSSLHVYFPDVDAVWKRAMEGGARKMEDLKDQFWGDRFGMFEDPFGQFWGVAKYLGKPHSECVAGASAEIAQAKKVASEGVDCSKSACSKGSCSKEGCSGCPGCSQGACSKGKEAKEGCSKAACSGEGCSGCPGCSQGSCSKAAACSGEGCSGCPGCSQGSCSKAACSGKNCAGCPGCSQGSCSKAACSGENCPGCPGCSQGACGENGAKEGGNSRKKAKVCHE
jgi:PhnB protein